MPGWHQSPCRHAQSYHQAPLSALAADHLFIDALRGNEI